MIKPNERLLLRVYGSPLDKLASSVASIELGKNLSWNSISPAGAFARLAFRLNCRAKEPLTVVLKTSLQGVKLPFSLMDRIRSPSISTGVVPEETAVPFTHRSCPTTKILLFERGPSMVAVRLGASRMSRFIDNDVGLI